jgi:hypothetical protein
MIPLIVVVLALGSKGWGCPANYHLHAVDKRAYAINQDSNGTPWVFDWEKDWWRCEVNEKAKP